MDQARISFFPDGLRVMIIDDDAKAVRRATATLSQLQYAGRLIWMIFCMRFFFNLVCVMFLLAGILVCSICVFLRGFLEDETLLLFSVGLFSRSTKFLVLSVSTILYLLLLNAFIP